VPVPLLSYYVYDHLGNTRVVYKMNQLEFCAGGDGPLYTIESAMDYYPYGKILRRFYGVPEGEKFLTTQHERDEETGFDYRGARFYDSDLGRFLSLDPLAAQFASWSAYNYVMGNPVVFIDPTGKSPEGWSNDNKDLANRFGLFGNGGESYSDRYGDEESQDPVSRFSGNSARGGHGNYETANLKSLNPDDRSKEIKDFVNFIIKKKAGTLTIEYEAARKAAGNFYLEKSWKDEIKLAKLNALKYPNISQEYINEYYDNQAFKPGVILYKLDFSDYTRTMNSINSELRSNGVDIDNLKHNTMFHARPVPKKLPRGSVRTNSGATSDTQGGAFLFFVKKPIPRA